jgi:uncharacterized alpha-E superfamily protein
MLKRVADSLYWMSRYIERAENTARLVDVSLQYVPDIENLDDETFKNLWEPILHSTGDYDLYYKLNKSANSESLTHFLTFDLENPSSIQSCVVYARQNAHMIRDQISTEMWEVINRLYHFLREQDAETVWTEGPYAFYKKVKEYSQLFQGLTDATYPRNAGYDFIEIGKYIERADKTGRILDMKYHLLLPDLEYVGSSLDHAQWGALLLACSAYDAYQKMFLADFQPKFIADILILSKDFPRSIRHCLDQLDSAMHRISGCPMGSYSNEAERICGRLISDLSYKSKDDIIAFGMHEQLTEIETHIAEIGLALSQAYMFFPVVDPALEESESTQTQS